MIQVERLWRTRCLHLYSLKDPPGWVAKLVQSGSWRNLRYAAQHQIRRQKGSALMAVAVCRSFRFRVDFLEISHPVKQGPLNASFSTALCHCSFSAFEMASALPRSPVHLAAEFSHLGRESLGTFQMVQDKAQQRYIHNESGCSKPLRSCRRQCKAVNME